MEHLKTSDIILRKCLHRGWLCIAQGVVMHKSYNQAENIRKVILLKIFPSKYSPKIFGSKYYPLLAIFSTKHKYTSYQLGVSDACEDFRWLNWCKTSWDKDYFSSECFSFLAIFLNKKHIYKSSIRCLRRL